MIFTVPVSRCSSVEGDGFGHGLSVIRARIRPNEWLENQLDQPINEIGEAAVNVDRKTESAGSLEGHEAVQCGPQCPGCINGPITGDANRMQDREDDFQGLLTRHLVFLVAVGRSPNCGRLGPRVVDGPLPIGDGHRMKGVATGLADCAASHHVSKFPFGNDGHGAM